MYALNNCRCAISEPQIVLCSPNLGQYFSNKNNNKGDKNNSKKHAHIYGEEKIYYSKIQKRRKQKITKDNNTDIKKGACN